MRPAGLLMRLAVGLAVGAQLPSAAAAATAQQRSQAYLAAVAYLRAQAGDAWEGDEAQAVLLGEALAADPLVAGPRSTAHLASLELASVDARGRRARTLAPLGLDSTGDREALLAVLAMPRPAPLSLTSGVRSNPSRWFGQWTTRVPVPLDNALAIQGLRAAGKIFPPETAINDAIIYLLEVQLADGSWALVRDGVAGAAPTGDLAVTAEVVLALSPYQEAGWTPPSGLPFVIDINAAMADAETYLTGTPPDDAAEAALRVLALLERDPTAAETADALNDLIARQSGGGFDDSAYATALAARAILRAAEIPGFELDTDGDSLADGVDPDDDGDGYCDPGEAAPGVCTGSDAFPLDSGEWADSDNDGVGDGEDADGDGDGVLDALEPGFESDPLESADADGDGVGDTADDDDDSDGVLDVDELLLGLDPEDWDTDGDAFGDGIELARGTSGVDRESYPLPDGDIFPLAAPDGAVDLRDALLAFRIMSGDESVPGGTPQLVLTRHGDVAPLVDAFPSPDGSFDAADALIIMRRATGELAPW